MEQLEKQKTILVLIWDWAHTQTFGQVGILTRTSELETQPAVLDRKDSPASKLLGEQNRIHSPQKRSLPGGKKQREGRGWDTYTLLVSPSIAAKWDAPPPQSEGEGEQSQEHYAHGAPAIRVG